MVSDIVWTLQKMLSQEGFEGACCKTHPNADRFFWDESSETHVAATGINLLRNRRKLKQTCFHSFN